MQAPVALYPDFIDGPGREIVFAVLWDSLPWERRPDAPRRECWMNDYMRPYTYGTGSGIRTYESVRWDPIILVQRDILKRKFGHRFGGCFVNGYEDGRDALGWHSDDSPEIDASMPIAVISLGAEREIWFRPIGSKGEASIEKLVLPDGSLLMMEPGMQQAWQHRIPKASFTPCPPRISLTYRGLMKKGGWCSPRRCRPNVPALRRAFRSRRGRATGLRPPAGGS